MSGNEKQQARVPQYLCRLLHSRPRSFATT